MRRKQSFEASVHTRRNPLAASEEIVKKPEKKDNKYRFSFSKAPSTEKSDTSQESEGEKSPEKAKKQDDNSEEFENRYKKSRSFLRTSNNNLTGNGNATSPSVSVWQELRDDVNILTAKLEKLEKKDGDHAKMLEETRKKLEEAANQMNLLMKGELSV